MIGAWMVHALVVAALLGAAAHQLERGLRLAGRPARLVWAAALVGSLLVPAAAALGGAPAAVALDVTVVEVDAVGPTAAAVRPLVPELRLPAVPAGLDLPLGAAWLLLSAGVAGATLVGLGRLARARRRWRWTLVDGREVLLSEGFGPAVLGVLRPEVVMPRWALDLEREDRRMVLLHEDEHRRGRDPVLLALGAVAVALNPWNPAVWWQARRLRTAVELDCDRRVIRRGAGPVAYGELLLKVGTRARWAGLAVPALLESAGSILERRLTMITSEGGRRWRGRALAGLAVAAVLVAMACETPMPTAMEPVEPEAEEALARKALTEATFRVSELPVEPIVYVDGVRIGRGPDALQGLDPAAIDRIEVVKGAAAEAVWGSAAKGGVIQIFTVDGRGFDPAAAAEARAARALAELEAVARLEGEGRIRRDGDGTFGGTFRLREVAPTRHEPDDAPAERERREVLSAKELSFRQDREGTATANLLLKEDAILIVDGVELRADRIRLGELDIERIEVLQGAAAEAVKPGATRVLRVTTRGGKAVGSGGR